MSENLPSIPTRRGEIVTIAERFPIFDTEQKDEIREVLDANLGPRGLDQKRLPRIKWPTGGNTVFMVESMDGDDEPVKEIAGFMVGWRDTRAYYEVPYAERGNKSGPPDCVSKDGYTGEGNPGGDCTRCPLAKFGSDPKGGRGQACKQIKQILLLREQHTFPDVVNIPPTSVTNFERYLLKLGNFRIPYWGLVTTIRLEKIKNPDGVDYARGLFIAGERLSAEERKVLAPFQKRMAELLRPMTVDVDDYYTQLADQDARAQEFFAKQPDGDLSGGPPIDVESSTGDDVPF